MGGGCCAFSRDRPRKAAAAAAAQLPDPALRCRRPLARLRSTTHMARRTAYEKGQQGGRVSGGTGIGRIRLCPAPAFLTSISAAFLPLWADAKLSGAARAGRRRCEEVRRSSPAGPWCPSFPTSSMSQTHSSRSRPATRRWGRSQRPLRTPRAPGSPAAAAEKSSWSTAFPIGAAARERSQRHMQRRRRVRRVAAGRQLSCREPTDAAGSAQRGLHRECVAPSSAHPHLTAPINVPLILPPSCTQPDALLRRSSTPVHVRAPTASYKTREGQTRGRAGSAAAGIHIQALSSIQSSTYIHHHRQNWVQGGGVSKRHEQFPRGIIITSSPQCVAAPHGSACASPWLDSSAARRGAARWQQPLTGRQRPSQATAVQLRAPTAAAARACADQPCSSVAVVLQRPHVG